MSFPLSYNVISGKGLEDTWEVCCRIIEANAGNIGEEKWRLSEDRIGQRLTASLNYQKPARLPRRLILEINFIKQSETRTRLEIFYHISPMIDISEPEGILNGIRDNIAKELSIDGQVYSTVTPVAGQLPEGKSDTDKSQENAALINSGEFSTPRLVDALLLLAIIIGFMAATGQNSLALLTGLGIGLVIILPAYDIGFCYKGFTGAFAAGKPFAKQTILERIVISLLTVGSGVLILVVATPIILLGLCFGLIAANPH